MRKKNIEVGLYAILLDEGEIRFVDNVDDCLEAYEQHIKRKLIADGVIADRVQKKILNEVKLYRYWINQGREELVVRTKSSFNSQHEQLAEFIKASKNEWIKGNTKKFWSACPTCCNECEQLHGKEVALDSNFITPSGKKIMHPPLHPGCRCILCFSPVAPLKRKECITDNASIYDQRAESAYRPFIPYDGEVEGDFSWWTSEHDDTVRKTIEKYQWNWGWEIANAIIEVAPASSIDRLKNDGIQVAWYNRIMYFGIARAYELGLQKGIMAPKTKVCPICNQTFNEASLPYPLVRRLGMDHLDFCSPCLKETVLRGGNANANREEIASYILDLVNIIKVIPHQGFGEGIDDLINLDINTRIALISLLKNKPSTERVKDLFGSWLEALIYAGILENGSRETSRGTQTLATDGHICYSLGEKTIDDFLHGNGISHEREIFYPGSNLRCDFLVKEHFIEYFGLAGNENYDTKIEKKRAICKKQGIRLIELYPKDLLSSSSLSKKLICILKEFN